MFNQTCTFMYTEVETTYIAMGISMKTEKLSSYSMKEEEALRHYISYV